MEHEHVRMLIIWNRDDLGDMIQKEGQWKIFWQQQEGCEVKGKSCRVGVVGDGYES